MNNNKYLVLAVDRQKALLFAMVDGIVESNAVVLSNSVPQKVKHGDDTWDAQDKIFRHIEDHLHRHLEKVAKKTTEFAKKNRVSGILIGGHKPLFAKVEKHIPYPFSKKIKGTFVTELKIPQNDIIKKAVKKLERLERLAENERLQKALQ